MNIFWDYEKLTDEQKIKENKKLLKEYPFLYPRSVWTDKELEDYDYTWTLLDEIPVGWRISFGSLFLDELKKELEKYNYLDKYRILQIKEKYGGLRWYDAGSPKGSKVSDIIDKYEAISENICINCGKPDVPIVEDSWISPYCLDCWIDFYRDYRKNSGKSEEEIVEEAKESYNKLAQKDKEIPDEIVWTLYDKDGTHKKVVDISETVATIKDNWKKYQEHIGK